MSSFDIVFKKQKIDAKIVVKFSFRFAENIAKAVFLSKNFGHFVLPNTVLPAVIFGVSSSHLRNFAKLRENW